MSTLRKLLVLAVILVAMALSNELLAQPPGPPGGGGGPPCWPPPCVPIDGGLIYLAIGGAIYGIKKAYDKRTPNNTKVS